MASSAVDEPSAPLKARGCTDLPWLFALAAFLGAAVFVASFALALGDPRRLIYGCDSFGNVCGARNAPIGSLAFSGMDATDRPYLLYFDLADPRNSLKICVSHCPSRALRTMEEVRRFGQETGSSLCRYDVAANNQSALSNATVLELFNMEQQSTGIGPCPKLPLLPSRPIRNRCVPYSATSDIFQSIYGYLNTAVLWWAYADIKLHLDVTPLDRLLEEAAKNERAFLAFAIGMTVLAVVLLAVAVVLHKRARMAGALFYEAGHCIRHMPLLLVQPVWTLIALAALFATWTVVFLHLATANHATRETRPIAAFTTGPTSAEVRHFTLVAYDQPSWVRFAWGFQLLFLLWAAHFMLACQQTVIAGAVASWYFCKDRTKLVWPLGRSAARLFLYHLGSIALGSVLIPLCSIPRLALAAFQRCTLGRRPSCFDKVSHNAYTVVAIRGTSFCTAGRIACSVLSESSLATSLLNGSSDFLVFLAKCLITSVVGLLAVVLLRGSPQLQLCAVPVLAVAVFSYFVSHCVLSLYGMVVDTLLLCFCEDVLSWEPNQRDLYAPDSLHRLLLGDTALLRPLPAQA
ncbi:hypothetical protein HPB50_027404 [Hyalomma asiaticum]|uniref:Uncharacterized protein n=1 Tax=Hyalomma asiaticum TaxID=266040 RepID=A0ACB7RTA6_HYAAI|nr:hypothetical protein HPB50_027404 [Hyalomma asiaticum]